MFGFRKGKLYRDLNRVIELGLSWAFMTVLRVCAGASMRVLYRGLNA